MNTQTIKFSSIKYGMNRLVFIFPCCTISFKMEIIRKIRSYPFQKGADNVKKTYI